MINLMPTEMKNSIKFARLNTSIVQYTIVTAIVIVLVAGVLFFGFTIASDDESALRASIEQKERDLAGLVSTEEEASSLASKIDTVGLILDREIKFSTVIQEIGSILPNGAVLTSLKLTNDTTEPFRVSALVDTKNTAAILRQNIQESELFAGADIESIVVNLDENGNADGFAVSVIASTVTSSEPPKPTETTENE